MPRRLPRGDVVAPVSPKLRSLWAAHARTIAAAMKRDAQAFDERWEAAGAIVTHDPPLFFAGGFRNAEQFFRDVLREAPRTAFRNIRVAKFASPKEEAQWGASKIDVGLSYLEAKSGKPLGARLPEALGKLRIPLARKGKTDGYVAFDEATVAQVAEATKRLLERDGRSKKKKAKGHARVVLEEVLSAHDALASVEVREKDGLVSLRNVPLAAWAAFITALRSAHWPVTTLEVPAAEKRKKRKKKK